MKILLLSNINSIHTRRWILAISKRGFEVRCFSLSKPYRQYDELNKISVHTPKQKELGKSRSKFQYVFALKDLKRVITLFKPDILHSHYISSYGVLGALTGFKNYFISVWGSDILLFPKRSFVNKLMVKFAANKALCLFSSSKFMAEEAQKYHSKVNVIPFGIDLKLFKLKRAKSGNNKTFNIGITKSLENVYGINFLIEATSKFIENNPQTKTKLLLIGDGTQRAKLENLVDDLRIKEHVEFVGRVEHSEIKDYYAKMDVAVFLSNSESFGVSVLEASACGIPVIVSDIGGLPEVTGYGKTGIIVPPQNSIKAYEALQLIKDNPTMAKKYGDAGRSLVRDRFNWESNVEELVKFYIQI